MKKKLGFLVSVAFLSLGMSEPASVPPEIRELRVVVTDSKGITHNLKGLHCDRGGNLRLKKGSLDYVLPFTSVRSIKVLEVRDGDVRVELTLKEGKKEVFEMSSSTRCTAISDVGNVSFYISEIKSIEVKGEKE